jgi:outer membrane protein
MIKKNWFLLFFSASPLLADMPSEMELCAAAFSPPSNLFEKTYEEAEADNQLQESTKVCTQLQADAPCKVEFRAAAFFPSSSLFRKIYGKVEADYQLQGSTKVCKYLDVWANLDWLPKSGHSVGYHDHTKINLVNGSVGLNAVYPVNTWCSLYVGAGPSVGGIWLKNKYHHDGTKMVRKCVVGGLFKSGVYFGITSHLFFDVFVDYLYEPVHFHNHVNVGGVKAGAGFGGKF